MCLLGIDLRRFDNFPVLILANREEFYARPSTGPKLFLRERENPAWIGGIDLLAGGTWLGLNEYGLLVAVTNRKKQELPANPPSRGLLCRKLLAGRETASVAEAAMRELEGNRFAVCNLLIADRDGGCVIEAADSPKMTPLNPGLHLLANGELNDPRDPRIQRVRNEFARANPATAEAWFHSARDICQLTATGGQPPIFLRGSDRGTVSSTVVGLGHQLELSRYWSAPGPPNSTAYDDYTPLLRQLFDVSHVAAGQAVPDDRDRIDKLPFIPADHLPPDIEPPADSPARRAVRRNLADGAGDPEVPEPAANSPYRILLRGPWQAEPLARTEQVLGATTTELTTPLPPPMTVRLPAPWQELFGSFRGRACFRRKFHPPSNITSTDRLTIVFDGVGGAGPVSLNGRQLGSIGPDAETARFDVTGLLRTNNELQIDLEFTGSADDPSPGGLFAPVALEIQTAS